MGLAITLGHFVHVEAHMVVSGDNNMALVLVDLHIIEGIPTEVKIVWGDKIYLQRLDYKGIYFRCYLCRNMGHMSRQCCFFKDCGIGVDGHGRPRACSPIVDPKTSNLDSPSPHASGTKNISSSNEGISHV